MDDDNGIDEVVIANMALSDAENASTISSLAQPNSKAARVCRLHFQLVRDTVLRRYAFGFSTDIATAVRVGPSLGGALRSVYQKPALCLRIIRVDGITKREWRNFGETQFLAGSNLSPLKVHYVKSVANLGLWDDPLAVSLLKKHLAIAIAPELSHSRGIIDRLNRELADLAADALLVDALEQDSVDDDNDDGFYIPEYLRVRC